jgi:hypothetical protein
LLPNSTAHSSDIYHALLVCANLQCKARRPMGDPFLMLHKSSEVFFGPAMGNYLLCGAGYKQQEWATMCGKLNASG